MEEAGERRGCESSLVPVRVWRRRDRGGGCESSLVPVRVWRRRARGGSVSRPRCLYVCVCACVYLTHTTARHHKHPLPSSGLFHTGSRAAYRSRERERGCGGGGEGLGDPLSLPTLGQLITHIHTVVSPTFSPLSPAAAAAAEWVASKWMWRISLLGHMAGRRIDAN